MQVETGEVKSYKFKLSPNKEQEKIYQSSVNCARFIYNYCVGKIVRAHAAGEQEVAFRTYELSPNLAPEVALKQAKKDVSYKIPSVFDLQRIIREDEALSWHKEHDGYVWKSGTVQAATSWSNWVSSVTGKRKGPKMGYPRYKRYSAYGSFRLHHARTSPTLRMENPRRFNLPKKLGGSVRIEGGNGRRLWKVLNNPQYAGKSPILSVSVVHNTTGWWLSVTTSEMCAAPVTTKVQKNNGAVGVDMGVKVLAALSDGTLVENPRHLQKAQKRLVREQRELSRKGWYRSADGELVHDVKNRLPRKPTSNRVKAQKRLAKTHGILSLKREGTTHKFTKSLVTNYELVAIEDLNVSGMSSSAKGTIEKPGKNVRAKAGLNRSILDASFGEIRRQLEYKSKWHGSTVEVVDRWAPTSKTCSGCGCVKSNLSLSERLYSCSECSMILDRDVNAAKNILKLAQVNM